MNRVSKTRHHTEVAPTFQDCLERIRSKWGNDYSIVEKREITVPVFWRFGSKRAMEVTYVVNDNSLVREKLHDLNRASNPMSFSGLQTKFEKEEELKKLIGLVNNRLEYNDSNKNIQQNNIELLVKKIEELSSIVSNFPSQQETHPVIEMIESLLEKNEFTPLYIKNIVNRIHSEFSLDDLKDEVSVQKKIVEWIGEGIEVFHYNELARKPTVFILVGPTGVGKTTTVAKMAAKYKIDHKGLNLRLVSIDHYRIAAQEQLKIYGRHMDIPTTGASSADDIAGLLRLDGDSLNIMFVDTIGLSPHDYEAIGRMRKLLDIPGCRPDVFLAISASTKASDLRDIMRNYETFEYEAVIITKFDETNHIGNILSVLQEKRKPVAFISSGQSVPNNFEEASVLRFLTKLTEFKIDEEALEQKFSPIPRNRLEEKINNIDGGTF